MAYMECLSSGRTSTPPAKIMQLDRRGLEDDRRGSWSA